MGGGAWWCSDSATAPGTDHYRDRVGREEQVIE
ncbi:hypothetical protein Rrhod_3875 [Rhodococcus rhodnii LMG 5362]|uniref:Uncharacterized protein n=1 Tax=Rhodococcus rhodnii LMG 5362 TaxID=1273125 RepID=R7WLD8_9NOCA|nr:hypothetical protein Rrhod_3875 [Rhodococcus rhodnii LMG 5362]